MAKPQPTVAATETPVATAPATAPAAVATAPKRVLHFVFTKPEPRAPRDGAKAPKYTPVANAFMVGVLGDDVPVVLGGWTVSRPTAGDGPKTLSVFLPSNGYGFSAERHIRPALVKLDEPVYIDGKPRSFTDDPRGIKAVQKLEAAIISAWGDCCDVPEGSEPKYGVPMAVTL